MFDTDRLFLALANSTRRTLLKELRGRPDASMATLQTKVESLTRFTIAKHLRVLEEAGLVTWRRRGREKLYRSLAPEWVHRFVESAPSDAEAMEHGADPISLPKRVPSAWSFSEREDFWSRALDRLRMTAEEHARGGPLPGG